MVEILQRIEKWDATFYKELQEPVYFSLWEFVILKY